MNKNKNLNDINIDFICLSDFDENSIENELKNMLLKKYIILIIIFFHLNSIHILIIFIMKFQSFCFFNLFVLFSRFFFLQNRTVFDEYLIKL